MKYRIPLIVGLIGLSAQLALAHSEAFTPEFVQTLVTPYLTLQQGLADDDLTAAQQGAAAYLEAMKQAPDGHHDKSHVSGLQTPARSIADAGNLEQARKALQALTPHMVSLIDHVGISGANKLYTVRCPMAFSGSGGTWIQGTTRVMNPYYGSRMLHCGSIQKQIAGEQEKTGHSGHKH